MKHVIGLGEILWDLLPDGKKLGGAPANFAYHAHAISSNKVEAYIASAIGNDALGREIQAQLNDLGVNQDYLAIDEQHKTGTVTVTVDNQGQPDYCIDKNVAWDFIPSISKSLINKADAVCFGSLAQRSPVSVQTILNFLDGLPENTLRIFDINLRQQFYNVEVIDESLKRANVFKINDEELQIIAQLFKLSGDENTLLAKLSEQYQLKLCILTKGDKGSVLYTVEQTSIHQGFKVVVKDTVGAGDAFTAAVVIGLLNDFELDYMHDCANRLAAFVCASFGA
ncbi:MAG: carbohydrate kinase, partial [Methylococcaceae bacterium]|nr:carbohydrate kinase [Methylococcaceae bacterium]